MHNIQNVISDTICYLESNDQIKLECVLYWGNNGWDKILFYLNNNPETRLEVEVSIDEENESVVATVLESTTFTHSEIEKIMNTFTSMF